MKEFRVVVAGAGGVGKSALTVQFVLGQFISIHDATIEDSYRKIVDFEGMKARVEILDTAGSEQFSNMRELHLRSGQGYILVYSIDDEKSYQEVEQIRKEILERNQMKPISIVIVGNKCDLEHRRRVSLSHGQRLAQHGRSSFMETSAKYNTNVNEVFMECVRLISRQPSSMESKRKRNSSSSKRSASCCFL